MVVAFMDKKTDTIDRIRTKRKPVKRTCNAMLTAARSGRPGEIGYDLLY
jgi:hypothetical protein